MGIFTIILKTNFNESKLFKFQKFPGFEDLFDNKMWVKCFQGLV